MKVTTQQIEVLRAIWETGSVKDAALKLHLSRKTIDYHSHVLRESLDLPTSGMIELFKLGLRNGWLSFLMLLSTDSLLFIGIK